MNAQTKKYVHAIAAAAVTAATLYVTNSAVHNAINGALAAHPNVVAFLGAISTSILAYLDPKKPQ
jgi:hypothetical protein